MKLSKAKELAEQAIYDYTSSSKWQQVKYMNWTTAEVQDVIAKALVKNIEVIPCCTELICDFDNINDGSLTKGKTYKKIHEHNGMIVIINDFDEVMSYNKETFFQAN